MEKVAVVGTTTWGTTLAILLGSRGIPVTVLARSREEAHQLNTLHENTRFLPGVTLSLIHI